LLRPIFSLANTDAKVDQVSQNIEEIFNYIKASGRMKSFENIFAK